MPQKAPWWEIASLPKKDRKPTGYDNLHGWAAKLGAILNMHIRRAVAERKTVSTKTMKDRGTNIPLCFWTLRELGYRLEDPFGLKEKHVQALVSHWEERKLSAATIQTYLYSLITVRYLNCCPLAQASKTKS